MVDIIENSGRIVKATHGIKKIEPDPDFEIGMTEYLDRQYNRDGLLGLYTRFISGESDFDMRMRRAIWRAVSRRFGHSVDINIGVRFKHLETFEIGNGVFIGAQTYVQGRFDGRCIIGDHVWIGPQSYFDARDLIIEDYVGWGPGAKVLGSTHTGMPITVPIIQTDNEIKPVRIEAWADIGTNVVILPGVTVGKGSIVGAGAVVAKDVPSYAVVAGVPARFLHWREGYEQNDLRDASK
jgi:acetyltransferase-like isoleucine patch superfamily enzyme